MSSGSFFDVASTRDRIAELETASADPELWADVNKAREVSTELSRIQKRVQFYDSLLTLVDDATAASEMAAEDQSFAEEGDQLTDKLSKAIEVLSIETLFSEELDDKDAIVSLQAGAGGTDAQDWTEMVLRMYLRWCEQEGLEAIVREAQAGDEAGVKSAAIEVKGEHAYARLSSEHGVHRIVRLSPFDSAHRRHTAFASVDVVPDLSEADLDEIQLEPDEIRIDTFRAGGPGGQHVNTTDSAVRITHLPTGLAASCQSERSQLQNKVVATNMLRARLAERRRKERQAEMAVLRGEQKAVEFGSQIRSYVFHPYQMVKDHRTNEESPNVERVLDGELNAFMIAWLKARAAKH